MYRVVYTLCKMAIVSYLMLVDLRLCDLSTHFINPRRFGRGQCGDMVAVPLVPAWLACQSRLSLCRLRPKHNTYFIAGDASNSGKNQVPELRDGSVLSFPENDPLAHLYFRDINGSLYLYFPFFHRRVVPCHRNNRCLKA